MTGRFKTTCGQAHPVRVVCRGCAAGHWRRHFTIIELMVVIAVITILASLLLPALSGVRKKVKTITCMNIQRQYGTAMFSYACDQNDYILNHNFKYQHPVNGWIGFGAAVYGMMDYLRGEEIKTGVIPCPEIREKAISDKVFKGMADNARQTANYIYGTYPVSKAVGGYYYRGTPWCMSTANDTTVAPKISNLTAPSQHMYLTERALSLSTDVGVNRPDIVSGASTVSGVMTYTLSSIDYAHSCKANMLFLDNHVVTVPYNDVKAFPWSVDGPKWQYPW